MMTEPLRKTHDACVRSFTRSCIPQSDDLAEQTFPATMDENNLRITEAAKLDVIKESTFGGRMPFAPEETARNEERENRDPSAS